MKTKIALVTAAVACSGAAQAQLPGLPGLPGGPGLPNVTAPALPTRPPAAPPVRAPRPSTAAGLPLATALPPLPDAGGLTSRAAGGSRILSGDLAQDANAVLGLAPDALEATADALEDAARPYRERARALLRRHRDVLEPDADGRPVVRGELVAVAVSPEALRRAEAAGFRVTARESFEGLNLATAVLAPPRGVAGREALKRLRALDPSGRYDLNHVYLESGAAAAGGGAAPPGSGGPGRGLRIGLVDGSAAPAAGVGLVQQAFAPGGARVTAHATAIVSLLAGAGARFRGAAPGATVYVADVYGPTPAGGSAVAVTRGLAWLARQRTPVINVSLVGPPNALLEAAVAALVAKGHVVVAAVGNDGPAAAPLYPAAYPGVVAVTGVDSRRRVLPEAGRGAHVAFAAPGADMVAAAAGGGVHRVRGTSFAAPLAAGRLAGLVTAPDPAAARRAIETLGREAADLGAPGRDPVFGRGLVAETLAVRPSTVAARR